MSHSLANTTTGSQWSRIRAGEIYNFNCALLGRCGLVVSMFLPLMCSVGLRIKLLGIQWDLNVMCVLNITPWYSSEALAKSSCYQLGLCVHSQRSPLDCQNIKKESVDYRGQPKFYLCSNFYIDISKYEDNAFLCLHSEKCAHGKLYIGCRHASL